jgi:hypothetical protein
MRQDYTLVTPIHQVFHRHYPVVDDLSIFARWSNAHGQYTIGVQLRTLEGDVVWNTQFENPFDVTDPLPVWMVPLPHLPVCIPRPGKYEIVLQANGAEVAADVLAAHKVKPDGNTLAAGTEEPDEA